MGADAAQALEKIIGLDDAFLTDDRKAQVREDKTASPAWVGVNDVLNYPFLSINQTCYSVVHIDVDDPDCDQDPIIPPAFDVSFYNWLNIPAPNITIQTTAPRFQAFWLLKKFMPFGARRTALDFYHDVRQKLNFALGGDASCNIRGAARNPFYIKAQPQVRCFSKERRDLADINPRYIRIPARTYQNQAHKYEVGNRNRVTFRVVLRRFKELGERASVQEMFEYAKRFQAQCNAEPLPDRENMTIASSVIRNGHKYRLSKDFNYGAMQLPEADWDSLTSAQRKAEIQWRQSAAAKWVHKKRKAKTRDRLVLAVHELQREGQRPTQKAVADRSGYSLRTVKEYWFYLGWDLLA